MSRAAIVALVLVAVAILGAIMFGGPIVDYWRKRTADAEAGQEQAVDNGVARGLETDGTAALAAADGEDRQTVVIIRESAHALELETRADVNASTRLPDSVLDRVRAGDRVLCDSGVECRPGRGAADPRAPGEDAGGLHRDGDAGRAPVGPRDEGPQPGD